MIDEPWQTQPACPGEYRERFTGAAPYVMAEVAAQNWSNAQQRRLPLDATTKWGVWVWSGGMCGSALGLTFASREAAREAALVDVRRRLQEMLASVTAIEANLR